MCEDNKNSELVLVSNMDCSEPVVDIIIEHIKEYWCLDVGCPRRASSIDELVESVKNAKAAIILGSKELKEAIDACLENSLPRVLYVFRYDEDAIPTEACLKQPDLNLFVILGVVTELQKLMLQDCIFNFLAAVFLRGKTK